MKKYEFTRSERALMEESRIPFAIYQFIDKRVVTIVLSKGFCELFGYNDREAAMHAMDNDLYKDTHPDDVSRIADVALNFAMEDGTYEVVYRSRQPEGTGYNIIHARGEHIMMGSGIRLAQVWYANEGLWTGTADLKTQGLAASFETILEEERRRQSGHYDYLTGLPSMTHFFDLAKAGVTSMIQTGVEPALLFIDLSGLKVFNRWHGFEEGDKLLRTFARLLIRFFGSDNCSRFGQDHFAVLTGKKDLEDTLGLLISEAAEMNNSMSLPVRIGICDSQLDEIDISIACDRAKIACDTLRDTYISGYCYFSSTMQDDVERQQYIVANIDRAIEEGWIDVFFQPIVRAINGKVCDEEALARWIDPDFGFLSPGDFIPALEDAQLIYKLDLHVLELVLRKLKVQEAAGLNMVPQSINLSRSDFDSCDIVEEIRQRVDASGIPRDLITIEITESIIGSDFEFMKTQIERFRELGFPVWMDDFGSGYSSLDVLQSIHFDLIKFDMRFMQQFESGESNRIILTELMKMATSLGVETVCEGVETKQQMLFLQEIGCSKLQGYFFIKPIPLEEILRRYRTGEEIGFENPSESKYYEAIGKINLYDLAVLSTEGDAAFHNYFDTLPMTVAEVRGDKLKYVRSNRSYREFTERMFGPDFYDDHTEYFDAQYSFGQTFLDAVVECCEYGNRSFVDEVLPDGTTIRSFLRRIAVNPVTGTTAIVIAVLSVSSENGATYENIARALAANYFNIFYVDLETEIFIEYSSEVGQERITTERRGEDFFRAARRDAAKYLYEEDRMGFIQAFTKENVQQKINEEKVFSLNYRLLVEGEPTYVNMKAVRMRENDSHIIVGVSDIDAQVRQRASLERMRHEQIAYARLIALAGDYLALYTVDPVTDRYTEYSVTSDYASLGLAMHGDGFFAVARKEGPRTIYPEDLPLWMEAFTKESVMQQIDEHGLFVINYRLMIDGQPVRVECRAALVEEADGRKLIVGVSRLRDAERARDSLRR